jgi:hypothetical protein
MNWHEVVENCVVQVSIHPLRFDKELEREFLKAVSERRRRLPIGFENTGVRSERKKAMAKAYKRQRRQRTERRLKNQRFIEWTNTTNTKLLTPIPNGILVGSLI